MTKIYFCKQIKQDFTICGESDPARFEHGRFTSCRNCRMRIAKEKKNMEKEKPDLSNTHEMNSKNTIRFIVEDTIIRQPLIEGYIISEKFNELEQRISDQILCSLSQYETLIRQNEKMILYVKNLENKIQLLEKELELRINKS